MSRTIIQRTIQRAIGFTNRSYIRPLPLLGEVEFHERLIAEPPPRQASKNRPSPNDRIRSPVESCLPFRVSGNGQSKAKVGRRYRLSQVIHQRHLGPSGSCGAGPLAPAPESIWTLSINSHSQTFPSSGWSTSAVCSKPSFSRTRVEHQLVAASGHRFGSMAKHAWQVRAMPWPWRLPSRGPRFPGKVK